ncbi:MAG: S8 family serine peptidase [Opitutaceae bacterium]|nr:S8 family serine peptidase [Opitutaceae bacterium]
MFMALWFVGTRSNLPQVTSLPPTPSPEKHTKDKHPAAKPPTDPATLPKDTVWALKDGTYAIALDELYVDAGPVAARLHTIAPQKNLPALLVAASSLGAQTGVQPRLVLYPLDSPRDESTRRIVTQQVHIETDNLDAVRAAASSLGIINWVTPDYAPGHAIAEVGGDAAQALRVAAALSRLTNVLSSAPLLAVQHAKFAVPAPDDTLFAQQWHLDNTGQQDGIAGTDINVTPVWATYGGTGINIGIVDDGVQITHPDLVTNAAASGHYDWNDDDADPAPTLTGDDHGTAVAGLAVARGNNDLGVSGVAPEATLYGLRLIAEPTTDQEDAEAMAWKNDVIHIKNNSWGPSTNPSILGTAGSLWQSAVESGTTSGRDGLGTIFVFASGNGKESGAQGNKNAYGNNIHVVAVGAIDNRGNSASFSEGGSHLVVSAPGESTPGIVTTDRTGSNGYNPGTGELSDQNYTQTFSGTSAAAPIVSGVIALMLEANPDLGWRDVKEILLRSSTQLQPSDDNWVERDGGQPSLPPIKHHEFFGGGLINAEDAVALAASWTPLGTEAVVSESTARVSQTIPDDPDNGLVFSFTPDSGPRLRVEHVEVTVNIAHTYRGDLVIKLTSPSGTVSTLASLSSQDFGNNYTNWTFSSVRHWGESSEGTWQLSIVDVVGFDIGTFNFATIKFSGIAPDAPVITQHPEDTAAALGSDVTLTVAGEDPELTYQWSRNGVLLNGKTEATLNLNDIAFSQVGSYTCKLTNAELVSSTSRAARVAVYDPVARDVSVNNGATFVSPTLTAGTFDSFQWYLGDSPLSDSARITGATTAQLRLTSITPADNGAYTLRAVLDGDTVTTGAANLTVRPPPDVTAPASQSVRLGASPALTLSTTGGPYTFAYTGLPKGVSYNPATGALTGRPTTAGTYTVFLAVTDGFSNSTTRTITLTVEPVPAALVGTFNGIVARDSSLNANLGGALTLTTTSTGAFSGKVTLGTASTSFKGQLDGVPGGPGLVNLVIPRTGLSSLQLQLSLPTDNTVATGTLNSTVAVTGWRNPWSKTNPANAYATKYLFVLEPPAGDGSVWPAGYSTGSVTVTTAGAASWTLLPADGSAGIKGTTTIAADGSLPLFAPSPTPVGSFLGTLLLPPSPSDSITGTVSWLRRSTSSTAYANAAGFGPVDLTPLGGRYTAPSSGALVLGLPLTTNNAQLDFEDVDLGALSSALSPFTFTVKSGNKIALPASNPTALKLTVTASTGLFSGSFVLADPNPLNASVTVKRTSKFSGVFVPNEDFGAGFFLLPALPGTSTGTRSGAVFFIETE